MEEPLTEELLNQLLEAASPQTFIKENHITSLSLSQYLQRLLDEKDLKRIDVIHAAGLNETYGYQLFMGEKANPSRDKLLALAFALRLNLTEANRLLKIGGANELYCKNRRDAIIIFGLTHQWGLAHTEEELYRFGEQTIAS